MAERPGLHRGMVCLVDASLTVRAGGLVSPAGLHVGDDRPVPREHPDVAGGVPFPVVRAAALPTRAHRWPAWSRAWSASACAITYSSPTTDCPTGQRLDSMPATRRMSSAQFSLIHREVEHDLLHLRAADDCSDATAICQAAGKRLHPRLWQETAMAFLEELSSVTLIGATGLVPVIQGGIPQIQGTWVHPQVAEILEAVLAL